MKPLRKSSTVEAENQFFNVKVVMEVIFRLPSANYSKPWTLLHTTHAVVIDLVAYFLLPLVVMSRIWSGLSAVLLIWVRIPGSRAFSPWNVREIFV